MEGAELNNEISLKKKVFDTLNFVQ